MHNKLGILQPIFCSTGFLFTNQDNTKTYMYFLLHFAASGTHQKSHTKEEKRNGPLEIYIIYLLKIEKWKKGMRNKRTSSETILLHCGPVQFNIYATNRKGRLCDNSK